MNGSVPLSLKSLQIIVLAMMAGVLVFAVIAVAIGSRNSPQPELARLLMPILVLVGVVELPAYFVVRRASIASLRRSLEADPPADDPDARVMTTFATLTIIGSAMAEPMIVSVANVVMTRASGSSAGGSASRERRRLAMLARRTTK